MTDRWSQMLALLRARFAPDCDVRELETFLEARGLDRGEIGEVLSRYLMDDRPAEAQLGGDGTGRRARGAGPLRVQGPHERGRFAPDAWGYLMMMYESGLVAAFDFEQLVERALFHIDGRIGLPDIRAMADDAGLDSLALGADHTLLH